MEDKVRIGVYICHCGTNIAGTVDVSKVAEFIKGLPAVVVAKDYMYMCSDPGQNMIKEDIKKLKLNRVVVASCSPTLHEHTFRQAVQDAGLNPYLFEMANIREQCSWVTEDPKLATEKAKALVSAAVKRIYYQTPLETREVPVTPNILVVGGGIAGIQTSLEIANSGYKVYLIEREPSIGGHMAQFDKTFPTLDCASCIFTPLLSSVGQHPNIELMTYSEVEEFSGYVGNYKAKILKKARYVDENKCNSCMVCVEKCPYKAVSEFDEVGLTPIESDIVRAPRLAESPVNMECKLWQLLQFGDAPNIANLVIGEVMLVHIKDEIWINNEIPHSQLKAVGRLGGELYCRTTAEFEMKRPETGYA